jgi:plasmid rolling circle replication initiator protein Rep
MSDYSKTICKDKIYPPPQILLENDFVSHKLLSLDIVEKYQHFNRRKALDMIDCGRVLYFNKQQHEQTHDERLKLSEMYTCKDRFCPFCTWRRSRKLALQSYAVLEAIQALESVRYLFLTLTVRNPETIELRQTVRDMMGGFNRLFKYKRVQKSVLGFMRALEVHPQKTNKDRSHPHFHVLLIVPARYFQIGSDIYLPQKEWKALWRKAMRLNYAPSVDIRAIKPKNDQSDALASVVAETCKYPVKSTDLTALSVEQFREFVNQMFRVRNLGYGGIFKEYRKILNLDDVEEGDLVHDRTEQEEALWITIEKLRYQFENGPYGLQYYKQKDIK